MSPSPSTRWFSGRSFFAKLVEECESPRDLPMSLSIQVLVLVEEVVGLEVEGIRGMVRRGLIVMVLGLVQSKEDVVLVNSDCLVEGLEGLWREEGTEVVGLENQS